MVFGAAALFAQEGRAPGDQIVRTALHDFRVETFLPGLVHPHSMAFTPEGDLLVTERPGRLRIVRNGQLLPAAVAGLPDVLYIGNGATPQDGREQAGLRDVVLHPAFATNRLLYLSYVKPGRQRLRQPGGGPRPLRERSALQRAGHLRANAPGNGTNRSSMWGGRIAFDRQGYLFVTLGDRQWPAVADLNRHPAQDLLTHNGKTVRLHDDGRVPRTTRSWARRTRCPRSGASAIATPRGMAFDPVTGDLWQNEHGPQGGDELNLIQPGANYGWPVIGYGVNYTTGLAIHEGTLKEGMTPPAYVWVPSIGVSGMIFYTGDRFSGWKGDMLVGGMSGQRLMRLRLNGQKVVADEVLIRRAWAGCATCSRDPTGRSTSPSTPTCAAWTASPRRSTGWCRSSAARRAEAVRRPGRHGQGAPLIARTRMATTTTTGKRGARAALLLCVAVAGGVTGAAALLRQTEPGRVDRDVAVPMRDGVVLRADVCRPAAPAPRRRWSTARRTTRRGTGEAARSSVPRSARGYAVVRAGRAGPLRVGRRLSRLRAGGPRRLRHHRVGGRAAVVERPRRHVRALVSRRGAVARRDRVAAASGGDGAGDDLRLADALLVHRRRLGQLLAAVDLAQHGARPAAPRRRRRTAHAARTRAPPGRPTDGRRSCPVR